jgi:hypothetical protein
MPSGVAPSGKRVPVQRDERGISYVIGPEGRRVYLAPTNTVANPDPTAPQRSFLTNYDWDTATGTWKGKTRWSNLIGLGTLGAIATPAALAASGAIGGGAGASGGLTGSGTVGGASTGGLFAPTGLVGTGTAGSVGAGGVGASTAAAGGGGMGWFSNVLNPTNLLDVGQVGMQYLGGRQAAQANDAQLRYLQDVEARRREEYDRAEALSRQQWEAEQALLAPRRAASNAILQRWAKDLGYTLPEMPAPTFQPMGSPDTLGDLARPTPAMTTTAVPRTVASGNLGTLARRRVRRIR